MKATPEYNRQKIDVTFATHTTTAVDTILTEPNLIHSILLLGHTWGGAANAATSASSGASGCILSLLDSDGNVLMAYTEVVTGTTTLLSADIMLFPNDVVRYAVTTDGKSGTVVSAAAVPTALFPTATVILYKY